MKVLSNIVTYIFWLSFSILNGILAVSWYGLSEKGITIIGVVVGIPIGLVTALLLFTLDKKIASLTYNKIVYFLLKFIFVISASNLIAILFKRL